MSTVVDLIKDVEEKRAANLAAGGTLPEDDAPESVAYIVTQKNELAADLELAGLPPYVNKVITRTGAPSSSSSPCIAVYSNVGGGIRSTHMREGGRQMPFSVVLVNCPAWMYAIPVEEDASFGDGDTAGKEKIEHFGKDLEEDFVPQDPEMLANWGKSGKAMRLYVRRYGLESIG